MKLSFKRFETDFDALFWTVFAFGVAAIIAGMLGLYKFGHWVYLEVHGYPMDGLIDKITLGDILSHMGLYLTVGLGVFVKSLITSIALRKHGKFTVETRRTYTVSYFPKPVSFMMRKIGFLAGDPVNAYKGWCHNDLLSPNISNAELSGYAFLDALRWPALLFIPIILIVMNAVHLLCFWVWWLFWGIGYVIKNGVDGVFNGIEAIIDAAIARLNFENKDKG
jgi:hypothetical protein